MAKRLLTVGEAAKELGVDLWMVNSLFRRRLVPEPERLGQFRVIFREDLPKLKEALRKDGRLT